MRAGMPALASFGCVAALAACTTAPASTSAWPQPPADRPVVDVAFTVADSLQHVTGTEQVTFTPDREICELVFRAWPNKPATAESGNALRVSAVRVAGASLPLTVSAGGAPSGSPGTLISARLPSCSPAGRSVNADLSFDLTLGADTDERVGYSPRNRVAWFGTAFPLLAWQRGQGWVKDPAVAVVGEMTTSEIFRLRSLAVTAPSRYAVTGAGQEIATAAAAAGTPTASDPAATGGAGTTGAASTTTHRFRAEAVRDVAVTVGDLDVTTSTVGRTTLRLALPARRSRADAHEWTAALTKAIPELESRFGPNPFPDLWVSVIPGTTDGVEFSGAVQFGDVEPAKQRWLILHELAHQWFYGLVGNNQARDPWMDEAFATYAQQLLDPVQDLSSAATGGDMGRPMSWFATRPDAEDAYVDTVYQGGGAALLKARKAAGADAFDAAIKRYLTAHAWQVAAPSDVAEALHDLPKALDVLRGAGALPRSAASPSSS